MNKTTIKIDSNKLRSLLENTANKSIYEIALESGYSKNVISNALRNGYASSAVQNIARLYGITPDMYKAKDPEPIKEPAQISIDDIETIKREELKTLIKEAIVETFTSLTCKTLSVQHDELRQRYIATLFINKEDIEEGK